MHPPPPQRLNMHINFCDSIFTFFLFNLNEYVLLNNFKRSFIVSIDNDRNVMMQHDYNGIKKKDLRHILLIHTKYPGMHNCQITIKKTHSHHNIFVTPHILYRIGIFIIHVILARKTKYR